MNRTKEAIIDVFWQLLEEKSYGRITVQSIVERCQVNRNTFYYHFQDIPSLAESSIQEWTESVIRENCQLGSPANCITPIAQEITGRKTAFIHLYHLVDRELFMQYLNQISLHIVQFYIDNVTEGIAVSPENRLTLIRYYKCVFVGVILDWFDNGVSYDLVASCDKMMDLFADSEKRVFLMNREETLSL